MELRKEKRIPVEALPEEYRTLTVYIQGSEVDGQVVDASKTGFGFRVSRGEENFIKGTRLALLFPNQSHRIPGDIVFVQKESGGSCRVGVVLGVSLGYDFYLAHLKQLFEE